MGGGAGFPGMGGSASAREFAGVGEGTAKRFYGCGGFHGSGVGEGDQSTGVSDGLKRPD